MTLVVNPDKFVVPYAIDLELNIYHIKDGRPQSDDLKCPACNSKVSFVSESEKRAAHFRHHDRTECEKEIRLLRDTIHNELCAVVIDMLNGNKLPKDICSGFSGFKLPTGIACAEKSTSYGGTIYRPDITVPPQDGEYAPTLELEVVWSHKPEPKRLEAAASAGRLIGILNASGVERSYLQKRYANHAFDMPEAMKQYVLEKRFFILQDRHIKRAVNGVLSRIYMAATIRKEHAAITRHAEPAGYNRAPIRYASPAQPIEKPVTKPVMQVMPQGSVHDVANTIIDHLRRAPDGDMAAITACLAPYAQAIAWVADQAPVRKIHIENLREYKLMRSNF
jgi:hypothetical protein